jgi:hypothetical protein
MADVIQAEAPVIVVRSVDQLRALGAGPLHRASPVVFQLHELVPAEALAAGERITRLNRECGCKHGALAMSLGSALTLALLVARFGWRPLVLLWHLPVVFGAALLFAGAGKAIGLVIARRRRQDAVQALLSLVEARGEGGS